MSDGINNRILIIKGILAEKCGLDHDLYDEIEDIFNEIQILDKAKDDALKYEREQKQSEQQCNCDLPQVSARLTIEELIWLKKFPEESFNANDFYDWAKENEGEAFALCLKIASSLNVR